VCLCITVMNTHIAWVFTCRARENVCVRECVSVSERVNVSYLCVIFMNTHTYTHERYVICITVVQFR